MNQIVLKMKLKNQTLKIKIMIRIETINIFMIDAISSSNLIKLLFSFLESTIYF